MVICFLLLKYRRRALAKPVLRSSWCVPRSRKAREIVVVLEDTSPAGSVSAAVLGRTRVVQDPRLRPSDEFTLTSFGSPDLPHIEEIMKNLESVPSPRHRDDSSPPHSGREISRPRAIIRLKSICIFLFKFIELSRNASTTVRNAAGS